jgi:ABC-type dipeptide/oligopeptide/nickel transport system ATPase subunit
MLLDEPTGDLDTKNTIEIMDLLLDINLKYKTTFVMVRIGFCSCYTSNNNATTPAAIAVQQRS